MTIESQVVYQGMGVKPPDHCDSMDSIEYFNQQKRNS